MLVRGRARSTGGFALLALIAAAAAAPATSAAAGGDQTVGAVYTQTNDTAANAVVVFDRHANGQLVQREVVLTGGQGGQQQQPGCTADCPILDTQGEVIVSKNGKLVFAVNAGSDTISSFRETRDGLQLVDQESSGGDFPESVTLDNHLLYVVNVNSGNIFGLRVSPSGDMEPIAGSSRSLSTPGPGGVARQIGFNNTGDVLAVTLLGTSSIDTFVVGSDGLAGPAVPHPSAEPLPFGFDFNQRDQMVVSQITQPGGPGTTSSYDVSRSGDVTEIDTESSDGKDPCWVAITNDGRHAFVVNTGGGAPTTIARYGLASDGGLTLLGLTPPVGNEFARTDNALSRDSRYLYVLSPSIFFGPTSKIDEYRVHPDGSLELIGSTSSPLAPGASGLAAR